MEKIGVIHYNYWAYKRTIHFASFEVQKPLVIIFLAIEPIVETYKWPLILLVLKIRNVNQS